MLSNFKYVHFPCLPESLILETYESILKNPNHFSIQNNCYRLYDTNKNLKNFVEDFIPRPTAISIHVIQGSLPIHVDIERTESYNYIIETGGDNVMTCFYQDKILIEQHKIEPRKWHWLNVSTAHNVRGIEKSKSRIALTVTP